MSCSVEGPMNARNKELGVTISLGAVVLDGFNAFPQRGFHKRD